MSVELHLPDLDVPIVVGTPLQPRLPWHARLRETLLSYLPLLLMVLLALGTWWLVKNAPTAPAQADRTGVRQEPDYTMHAFTLQRFAPDGRLQVRIEGRELRHYPADDRIEVDRVELRAIGPDGRITLASARQAVGNGAATELTLTGGAEVTGNDVDGTPVVIRSEYLHASLDDDTVRTDRPVEIDHGRNVVRAAGAVYDHAKRAITLDGPMRAVLQTRP